MKKISIILVIIWMIVIFMFSNMNGTISGMQSNGIVTKIADVINYTGNIDTLRLIVRKCAHFTEYLILGILVLISCLYIKTTPSTVLYYTIIYFYGKIFLVVL